MHQPTGRHVLLDGFGADPALLDDPAFLGTLLREACEAAGATVLREVVYRFEPQGVTAAVVLSESHASVHTYPEHGTFFVDVFTCGSVDPKVAADLIVARLAPSHTARTQIARGEIVLDDREEG